MTVGGIDHMYIAKYPISYMLFTNLINAIRISPIAKYPVQISVEETRMSVHGRHPIGPNLVMGVSIKLSDSLSAYTNSLHIMINDQIEILTNKIERDKVGAILSAKTHYVPLDDPSVDFIKMTLDIVHDDIKHGIKSIMCDFYEDVS